MPARVTPQTAVACAVHVELRGQVGEPERDCAQAMISAVLRHHRLAADGARVRLAGSACGKGPALVQVNLRVCGAPARIQVAGRSAALAIAAAAARLDRQIRRLTTAWEPWPWPDPERRPLAVPIEGRITRVKQVRLHVGVPCQATAAMNAMDFDMYLFTDAETGEDAIVYRAGPTGIRLARQQTMRPPSMPVTLPLTTNPHKIPTLTPDHAAQRLAECWLPFVFFTDLATGRGNLLYRRYDGDLGLIAPHASPAPPDAATAAPQRASRLAWPATPGTRPAPANLTPAAGRELPNDDVTKPRDLPPGMGHGTPGN